MKPALEALVARHARRAGTGKIVMSLVFASLSVAVVIPFARPFLGDAPMPNRGDDTIKLMMGAALALVLASAGALVVRAVDANTARVRGLLAEPFRIVWIYGVDRSLDGLPSNKPVVLVALDGSSARLVAGPQAEVLATLHAEVPHAILGYGVEQATEYERRTTPYATS